MGSRVLLVEDDEAIGNVVAEALRILGCEETTWAASLARGIELAHESCYDLILLDNRLPDGQADAFVGAVHPVTPQVPIVIATGSPDSHSERALELGAVELLPKPFGLKQLRTILERYV